MHIDHDTETFERDGYEVRELTHYGRPLGTLYRREKGAPFVAYSPFVVESVGTFETERDAASALLATAADYHEALRSAAAVA